MEIFWPKVESREANLTKIELVNIKVGRGSGIVGRFASLLTAKVFFSTSERVFCKQFASPYHLFGPYTFSTVTNGKKAQKAKKF